MKILTVLKYLINFIFITYLVSACLWLGWPFYDNSYAQYDNGGILSAFIIVPLIHMMIIFMILFYLRKFVHNAEVGTPLEKSTRKHLKLSGIFCLIYGFLRIPEVAGIIAFYKATGEFNPSLINYSILDFGSLFFTFFIGLFFIYLSKVLEYSDTIRQENILTI